MTLPPALGIPQDRPVLSWRWIAGGLLHFAIVAYLVLVPLLCLLLAPSHASIETLAQLALRFSLWFLVGLAAVTLSALPAAAVLDAALRARRRRTADQPTAAALCRRRLEDALRISLDGACTPLLVRIAAARWDHDDVRHQALARDLEELVRAAAAALASAGTERRAVIAVTTAQALTRIVHELDALVEARAQADEAQVQTLSSYVATRYPTTDFPFEP